MVSLELQQIFHVKTPLDVAAENGNEVIVSNLLKKGAKPEWQMEQVRNNLIDS